MTDEATIDWHDLVGGARTGDLMLFHGGEFESEVIEALSGGKFSHVAMIVRPDPNAQPLLWEENGVPLAGDPEYPANQQVITASEGRPFPSLLEMAASWLGAQALEAAAPSEAMFCSQLVAFTLQGGGILEPDHVPNYYSPNSFSVESAQPLDLVDGASYAAEIAAEPPPS